ncbi:hypothetical protein SynA1528_02703 [Synechococcus sp. A15-28]|nr:hypothetical protein SynA1528_02703 [Synechococcus sp. A15-28]
MARRACSTASCWSESMLRPNELQLQRVNLDRAEQRNVLESSRSFAFEYRLRNS